MYGSRRKSLLRSGSCMLRNLAIMDAAEPQNNAAGPPCAGLTCGPSPKSARLSTPPPSSPSPKRSRRSIPKRVVSIPIQDAAGADGSRTRGVSECAPPSDSWAWRKYGQKPIKGSPYPRGYYRCSSSKGCPARKQVERSRVDPTLLVVTYACEHNHPWPMPKNHSSSGSSKQPPQQQQQQHVAVKEEEEEVGPEAGPGPDPDPDPTTRSPPDSGADLEESRFSDLIGEDSAAAMMTTMLPDDFWYSDVGSTSSTSPPSDTLLYGPIFVAPDDECCEKIGDFKDDDEDALFAGLGELPEYSTVFRRSYLDRRQQQLPVHTAVHQ